MSVPSIEKLTALQPWTVVGVKAGDLLDYLADAADAVAAAHAEATTRPTLAERQARYLEIRGHTLSIDGKPRAEALLAQGRYVLGEAWELVDAVEAYAAGCSTDEGQHLRHEIADVVIAAVTLANLLGVTVEACIAEKTEADRGRG